MKNQLLPLINPSLTHRLRHVLKLLYKLSASFIHYSSDIFVWSANIYLHAKNFTTVS